MQTSSFSSKSKKRKREVFWMDVLESTSITDKETVLPDLEIMSVEQFCRLTPNQRERFCNLVGLTGWGDELTRTALKVYLVLLLLFSF